MWLRLVRTTCFRLFLCTNMSQLTWLVTACSSGFGECFVEYVIFQTVSARMLSRLPIGANTFAKVQLCYEWEDVTVDMNVDAGNGGNSIAINSKITVSEIRK